MIQRLSRSLLIAAAMLGFLFASPTSADIAPNPGQPRPRPTPPPPAPPPANDKATDLPLTIKLHDNATPMKLELPEKQAGTVKGAAAVGDSGGTSGSRTIIAAAMLSLGAIAGGLWLARKRSRGEAMAVATVLAIAAAGLWVSDAFGNRPAPPPVGPPKPVGLSIRIESNAKGEAAILHISEEQLKAIAGQLAAQKKAAANAPVAPAIRSVPPPPG